MKPINIERRKTQEATRCLVDAVKMTMSAAANLDVPNAQCDRLLGSTICKVLAEELESLSVVMTEMSVGRGNVGAAYTVRPSPEHVDDVINALGLFLDDCERQIKAENGAQPYTYAGMIVRAHSFMFAFRAMAQRFEAD